MTDKPKTYQCALVGMHFRPPARQVLAVLPLSTELELRRAADNPYDANAVEVWVRTDALPEMDDDDAVSFEQELQKAGSSLDELCVQDEIQLGFLGASAKLIEPGQSSNAVVAEALDAGRAVAASLTVSLSGKASVLCRVGEQPRHAIEEDLPTDEDFDDLFGEGAGR